jgi:hypothetical protein
VCVLLCAALACAGVTRTTSAPAPLDSGASGGGGDAGVSRQGCVRGEWFSGVMLLVPCSATSMSLEAPPP